MYIQQLTKNDIEQIFTKLLLIIERGDEDKVNSYFKNCKIKKSKDVINISFNTGYETHTCNIYDFNTIISYGSYMADKTVTVTYRKHMYEKFGNNYYNDMRDFYKKKIIKKYDKELKELSDELNEVIK